jgi:hypothetical protein
LVEYSMVISLQPDTNLLFRHCSPIPGFL